MKQGCQECGKVYTELTNTIGERKNVYSNLHPNTWWGYFMKIEDIFNEILKLGNNVASDKTCDTCKVGND